MITLQSIQVGRPRIVADGNDPWVTALFKTAVDGPVRLGVHNLDGDEQADLTVHGGPDKAVCVYSADHFETWRREPGIDGCQPGAFGENFTIAGQDETSACVGDVYEVGDAVVQVSQPRGPCWKLARRWQRPDFVRVVLTTGRTGWYVRVLREGVVEAGAVLRMLERPYPEWTIQRVNQVYHGKSPATRDAALALATCPALAEPWRVSLAGR